MMTVVVADTIPSVLRGVERALVDWLPKQRWFGGKGRPIRRVDLTMTADFAGRRDLGGTFGVLTVADVHYADAAGGERYHLPLALDGAPPGDESMVVTRVDGVAVSDATGLPDLASTLLDLIGRTTLRGSVRFAAEPRGELAFALRNGLPGRRLISEQSNTSLVFGDRFILKLFRRLPDGVNPDLEVHRALRRSDNSHVVPLLGAIEGDLNGRPVTYGMLSSFAADSTDGWQLATADARAVVDGRPGGGFDVEARLLGNAVAAVHHDLAQEFGRCPTSVLELYRLRDRLLRELDRALGIVPALRPYAGFLRRTFTAVSDLPAGAMIQRIHGDLHLGQVLRTPARWLLIDFEGEPAAPVADRVRDQSPLRDVAGMIRSFDYAAAHGLREAVQPAADAADRASAWAAAMRQEFCRGYGEVAGADPREHGALLRVHELEKLVYEAVYETRNRPSWVRVPLRSLRLRSDAA
jgi:maltokinase